MIGFVESFNVSVAAALVLHQTYQYRKENQIRGDLSEAEKDSCSFAGCMKMYATARLYSPSSAPAEIEYLMSIPIEPVEIQTPDGWVLKGEYWAGPSDATHVVLMGHAMMADRRTLVRTDRPCLGKVLHSAGIPTVCFDARGRGESGPQVAEGGQWTYHELVDDTKVMMEWVRSRFPNKRITVLGHSLFGHTALAWFGKNPESAPDAFVAIAVNIWTREWEPSASGG